MQDSYLFGAVYIIEQEYSDEDIKRDLSNIKDMGFNLITLPNQAEVFLLEGPAS